MSHTFDNIISVDNLLLAWKEFQGDKKNKIDVREFSVSLMDNIYSLHDDLKNKIYRHGGYYAFKVSDPKPRDIHKASVRDRLLHHAIYRILYPYFDNKFIHDSYSCRVMKGTHKAMQRFSRFVGKVSKNGTCQCYVLKCDIRKFFANIDHGIMINIFKKYNIDSDTLNLLEIIVRSFESKTGVGLPLGNLTSQLFVNIYMNEFDQHIKHKLKVKYYIRYADDFVVISQDKMYLQNLTNKISTFLSNKLCLGLNPNKVFIKTIYSGIDFLGWKHFVVHKVLRSATKKRMFKILNENNYNKDSKQSYLGMLKFGNANRIRRVLEYSKS